MFRRWFGKRAAASAAAPEAATRTTNDRPDASVQIAYVMYSTGIAPPAGAVLEQIRRRLPHLELTADSNPAVPAKAIIGTSGSMMCAVGFIDAPNPLGPQESFIMSAWWWPEAAESIDRRKGHAIVSVAGIADARQRAILLGKLTAAVVDATPGAIGVIWNEADAVWKADHFRASIDQSGDELPVPILVSVKVSGDTEFPRDDGNPAWGAMTYGLAAFELMEVEVRGWDGEPEAMVGQLLDIATYLAAQGPVIKDGDTLGPGAGAKFRIKHEASTFDHGKRVYRLYQVTTH